MREWLKRVCWRVYERTGPIHAVWLGVGLLRRHGVAAGLERYRRLPAGDMHPADKRLQTDQHFLLERTGRLGPVFKCNLRRGMVSMVVGNDRARSLLTAHGEGLRSQHKDLTPLFPIGHLRAMQGEQHRRYRQAFVRALRPDLVAGLEPRLRDLARAAVRDLITGAGSDPVSTPALRDALGALATAQLMRLFLGVDPADAVGERLRQAYAALAAGYAPAYHYGDRHDVYLRIRAEVDAQRQRLLREPSPAPDSVLQRLTAYGGFDDTVAGNLIYMVESGRFDLSSLLRWIVFYLTEAPATTERVRAAGPPGAVAQDSYARAVVLETLRCNQSEAIQRRVDDDLEHDGHWFPKGSGVRFCTWEAHKDPDVFPEPFRFAPERFLDGKLPLEHYAPFGLDQHRCPASELVLALGTIFVQELARCCDLRRACAAAPVWGAYHWEPGTSFSFHLVPVP